MTDAERSSEGQLRVLVVEDNPGDIRLIREGFEKSSAESSLTVVTTGEEALDYLSRRNGYGSESEPDLTLLDLNIPKKSGEVVLETIRGDPNLRSLPVLILSGSEAENHIRETRELGADGYFTKPVNPLEFISLVAAVGDSMSNEGTVPSGAHDDLDTDE